jgi:hypothetical protein
VFRYVERTWQQALVQKLTRVITGLRAAWLLLDQGFLQEQAVLQRVLDELHEDISFLALGAILNDMTSLHTEYLSAFYEEEFDSESAIESTQKRPMISRKKIRAYVARTEGLPDPSRGVELYRTLSKAYSGFVHGASPHIMDMYGGDPPQFHIRGMLGTPREREYRQDLWNYFFRSIIAFSLAARALGDEPLFEGLLAYKHEFERKGE